MFILRAIRSEIFFRVTLIWFGIQAGWIALSGLYPMAYDEAFHFNVTRLYTDKLLPFWSNVPEGSSTYGAIARDPSYLYHYLMSFPLRLVEICIRSETGQILFMRFCSIAFFIIGLWIFRKVLLRAKLSVGLSNLVICMVAATPLVSLLAAQVNYDNFVFMLLPVSLLYFQKILEDLKKLQVHSKNILIWTCLCMFACLVKYAFLPIALAMLIILVIYTIRYFWRTTKKPFSLATQDFWRLPGKLKIILSVSFIILFGLCFERYGVNLIKYQTPAPECNQVLTVEECLNFSPWRRNYYTRRSKLAGTLDPGNTSLKHFVVHTWLSQTTYQLFYTLDGARANYLVGDAYPIPRKASVVALIVGTILGIIRFGYIRKHYKIFALLLITLLYLLTLLIQNYADFIHLGYPFGIQGRYVIPVLPLIYAFIGVAFVSSLQKIPAIKPWIALVALTVIITQGGGAGTYILRSNSDWYRQKQYIIQTNNTLRKILTPLILAD